MFGAIIKFWPYSTTDTLQNLHRADLFHYLVSALSSTVPSPLLNRLLSDTKHWHRLVRAVIMQRAALRHISNERCPLLPISFRLAHPLSLIINTHSRRTLLRISQFNASRFYVKWSSCSPHLSPRDLECAGCWQKQHRITEVKFISLQPHSQHEKLSFSFFLR